MMNRILFSANNPRIQKPANAPNVEVRVTDKPKPADAQPQDATSGFPVQAPATPGARPACGLPIKKPEGQAKPSGFPVNRDNVEKDEEDIPDIDPNKNYSVC